MIVGHAALRSGFRLIETQIWVQFGSNLGPTRISNDCFALTSALFGVAKLLKIRLSAFSQRGGQWFDPAQLHQGINHFARKIRELDDAPAEQRQGLVGLSQLDDFLLDARGDLTILALQFS